MNELSPVYLSAIAVQLGGLSAFLGGFAATFLAMLLGLSGRGRAASFAIGFTAIASVAFIVAVVGSTALVAVLHPDAPGAVAQVSSNGARAVMTLAFLVGLFALLFSVGFSGWARSRGTGWTTSLVAGVGVVLVTSLVIGIG